MKLVVVRWRALCPRRSSELDMDLHFCSYRGATRDHGDGRWRQHAVAHMSRQLLCATSGGLRRGAQGGARRAAAASNNNVQFLKIAQKSVQRAVRRRFAQGVRELSIGQAAISFSARRCTARSCNAQNEPLFSTTTSGNPLNQRSGLSLKPLHPQP